MKITAKKLKTGGIFWGLLLIVSAVLLIVDGLGISLGIYDISAWQLIIGVLFIAWGIKGLFSRSAANVIFPLAFLFMLFEGHIARAMGAQSDNLISNWIVLLAALLLTIGLKILIPGKLRKALGGVNVYEYSKGRAENAMGHNTAYVDAKELGTFTVENAMGKMDVYIENADMYAGGGRINVENAMGQTVVYVPADWHIELTTECAVGTVSNRTKNNPDGKVLYIHCECAVGNVEITPI